MAWLTGWNYRKSHVVNQTANAGAGYQVRVQAHQNGGLPFYGLSGSSATVTGNPVAMHNFQPVHATNIQACNLTIDGSQRTYLAYDTTIAGDRIKLYYSNDLTGAWTAYSGNPILGISANHYRWPSVILVGSTLHMFLTDRSDGTLERWTSTDGITFTFQENVISGGNEYKNPFIWLNPNDGLYYLYHHITIGSSEGISVRSAATITGLAAASDTTVLDGNTYGYILAAPTVFYKDSKYWMLVETGGGDSWSVIAFCSNSPTSGFVQSPNSPILTTTQNEACPICVGNPTGSAYYVFTSHDNGSGTWTSETRTLTDPTDIYWVDLQGHALSNYGDIRFTASDGSTLLDYWIEESNANYATIWVELSDNLTSANSTIYIYYGKSDATTAANGNNTFTFFDDFSGTFTDKWTVVSGTWVNAAGVLEGSVTTFGQRARATGITVGNHAIHFKSNWQTGSYFEVGLFARGGADESANSYIFYPSNYDTGTLNIVKRLSSASSTIATEVWNRPATGNWYKFILKMYGTTLRGEESTVPLATISGTDSSFSSGTVGFIDWDDTEHVHIDDLFIRKYVEPEPVQSTWAAEEIPGTITITSPVHHKIFLRTGTIGNIVISGTYTGSPTAIEASFNGGAYATIVASPSSGTYSGTLSNQAQGQGTLTVRFVNITTTNASVNTIGIGENFGVGGQSNAVGEADSNQIYTHPSFVACLFGNDYNWKELIDPYDDATGQLDTVSADVSDLGGSVWPVVATKLMQILGCPVGFVPCALSGSAITQWQPGANHQDRTTLYGSMVYRCLQVGVRGILWWQGETEGLYGMSSATYNNYLDTIANGVQADLGVKLVAAKIEPLLYDPYIGDPTNVNAAIETAYGDNTNVLRGPNFDGIDWGAMHYASSTVYFVGSMWYQAIIRTYGWSDYCLQSSEWFTAASNTANCSLHFNATTGNVIIVAVVQAGGTLMGANSISDNHGNTYHLVGSPTQHDAQAQYVGIYYAYNITGGALTVTFTGTNTPDISLAVHEYPIKGTSDPLDKYAADTSNGTVMNSSNTATTVHVNELIFGAFFERPTANNQPIHGTDFQLRESYPNGGTQNNIQTEDKIVSSIGAYNAVMTQSVDGGWAAVVATFNWQLVEPTLESISLSKRLSITQPFSSATDDGTSIGAFKGVSVVEQIIVQGAVSLAKFATEVNNDLINVVNDTSLAKFDGITALSNVNVLDTASLAKFDGITVAETISNAVIEESVSLAIFKDISASSQISVQDTALLLRIAAQEISNITNIIDLISLAKFNGAIALSNINVLDTASLAKFLTYANEGARPGIEEAVTLSCFLGVNELSQISIQDTVTLIRIAIQDGVTQANAQNATSVTYVRGVTVSEFQLETESIIFTRSDGIAVQESLVGGILESVTLARFNDITSVTNANIQDSTALTRIAIQDNASQCQVNDSAILNQLIGISSSAQCQVNDSVTINRLIGINQVTQCQVSDTFSLAKFVRVIIIDETQGQYSENIIFNRFISLAALQEGISHVSESISVNRLSTLTVSEQSRFYDSLLFNRSIGINNTVQSQIINDLILTRSNGLDLITQNSVNENITVNKISSLNSIPEILLNELINLPAFYSTEIFDSRYLLETVALEYVNGIALDNSPSIFEEIYLGKTNIVTVMAILFGFNSLNLDLIKSIAAEPPSLYVYNDGNHSVAVLFRDKRVGVYWRDKRVGVHWRDKRGG